MADKHIHTHSLTWCWCWCRTTEIAAIRLEAKEKKHKHTNYRRCTLHILYANKRNKNCKLHWDRMSELHTPSLSLVTQNERKNERKWMQKKERKIEMKALWYFRVSDWCMHALCCSHTKAKLFPHNVIKSFVAAPFFRPNSILCHHQCYWLPITHTNQHAKKRSHVLSSFRAFPSRLTLASWCIVVLTTFAVFSRVNI